MPKHARELLMQPTNLCLRNNKGKVAMELFTFKLKQPCREILGKDDVRFIALEAVVFLRLPIFTPLLERLCFMEWTIPKNIDSDRLVDSH